MRKFLLVFGLLLMAVPAAAACPFCSAQGQSLSGEVAQSDFIVLGTMTNAKPGEDGAFSGGSTDLVIESVIKPHPYLLGRKIVPIPRYIPVDPAAKNEQFLVFCSLYARPSDFAAAAVLGSAALGSYEFVQIDAVRGDPVKLGSQIASYLKGGFAIQDQPAPARLAYFFDFLDAPDLLISTDAMNEFAQTDYADVRVAAPKMPAAKIRRWLEDPGTPTFKVGLYGLLIGHCGTADDTVMLRKLLDAPDARFISGRDGLLAGYTLLDPAAGYSYMIGQLMLPEAEFQARYAVLKALRFFWDYRSDVLSREQVLAGIKTIVAQPDMADIPIEDLRKWKAWDQTDFVLSFLNEPEHMRVPITRRAILRFALAAPVEHTAAKEYVERVRREDPERVKYVEQTLADEAPPTPTPAPPAKSGG